MTTRTWCMASISLESNASWRQARIDLIVDDGVSNYDWICMKLQVCNTCMLYTADWWCCLFNWVILHVCWLTIEFCCLLFHHWRIEFSPSVISTCIKVHNTQQSSKKQLSRTPFSAYFWIAEAEVIDMTYWTQWIIFHFASNACSLWVTFRVLHVILWLQVKWPPVLWPCWSLRPPWERQQLALPQRTRLGFIWWI